MSVDDHGLTVSSRDCGRNGEENSLTEMAGILLSLESLLKQLIQASKAQTEGFNNLKEDNLLQPNPNEKDKGIVTDETSNLLDLTTVTNQSLDSSSGQSPCLTIRALTKGQTTTF